MKHFIYELRRNMTFMKKRLKKFWIGMLGMTCVTAGLSLVHSIAVKMIIDASIDQNVTELKKAIIFIVVGMVLLMTLVPFFHRIFNFSAKEGQAETQSTVFNHRSRVSVSYFEKNHSGKFVSKIFNDAHLMFSLYTGKLRRFISPVVHGLACIIPMYIMSYQIATVLLFVNILSASVNLFFADPIRRKSSIVLKKMASLTEELINLTGGIKTHKMFKTASPVIGNFNKRNSEHMESSLELDNISALLESVNDLIGLTVNLGILAGGIFLVSKGHTTIGSLMAIIQLQRRLNQCFLDFGVVVPLVQQCFAGTESVFEFLQIEKEAEFYSTDEHDDLKYLDIRDLSFSYNRYIPVLNGINLQADKGEIIALVGDSGGGKSTIMKLLLALYKPESGVINIGNMKVGEEPLNAIRNQSAYVPQDAYVFNGTVEDNIRLGKQDASMDEVINAAKLANAHDFISELSNGYKTEIGERGYRISGGQRQRLAIARAILKDAPILLLDEATSSLDSESEQLIQDSLNILMENRTSVVIAHRLSTIEHADRIYVLDNGKIVETGNHRELLDRDGYYTKLYNRQFA